MSTTETENNATITAIGALGKNLVVLPDDAITMTKGGIALPNVSQEKPSRGTVKSKGYDVALQVNVDDRVLFKKYHGTPIECGNDELLIINEDDILAKIND